MISQIRPGKGYANLKCVNLNSKLEDGNTTAFFKKGNLEKTFIVKCWQDANFKRIYLFCSNLIFLNVL